MGRRHRLPRIFYRRDPRQVAPDLLGLLLVHGDRSGRIVEVEAYAGAEDPGSHAFRGPTPRTEVMFGSPGLLYVYFSYGIHWCANVVCHEPGTAGAVLLRALAPVTGVDAMWGARPAARRERDLTSGPARLTQALGLDGSFGGADLVTADRDVWLADDGARLDRPPTVSPRIGLTKGTELPWRWYVEGDPHVSGRPR